MNRKQYEAKRLALMNEAQTLLDAGKVEEANAKMEEVKALDAKWDEIAQAEANFNALNREPAPALLINEGKLPGQNDSTEENPIVAAWKSEEYKMAWAKTLMGRHLNAKEQSVYDQVNAAFAGAMTNEAFTHTTSNTGIVIPETVSKGIWEMVSEKYPYFDDVAKTYINGLLTMIKEKTSSDAGWYEEDTPTEDGEETFDKYTLNGCELSRSITISWKLKEMAIEEFIPYIQRKMAKKMGIAVGYGVTHGKGNANEKKPEPTGVVTALLAEAETPRVVKYKGVPTYENFVNARSKIASGYSQGLAIYANNSTIWNKIAMIQDLMGRPLFVPDVTGGGANRVLGMVVKEDGSMRDGEILLSNAYEGFHANINKELSMMQEDHVKARTTDYAGYAIMDGNVITTEAHALLQEEVSADIMAAGVPTAVKVPTGVTDDAVEAGAEAAEAVTEDTAVTKKSTAKKES